MPKETKITRQNVSGSSFGATVVNLTNDILDLMYKPVMDQRRSGGGAAAN